MNLVVWSWWSLALGQCFSPLLLPEAYTIHSSPRQLEQLYGMAGGGVEQCRYSGGVEQGHCHTHGGMIVLPRRGNSVHLCFLLLLRECFIKQAQCGWWGAGTGHSPTPSHQRHWHILLSPREGNLTCLLKPHGCWVVPSLSLIKQMCPFVCFLISCLTICLLPFNFFFVLNFYLYIF